MSWGSKEPHEPQRRFSRVNASRIQRMRDRAEQMRRAAGLTHNQEIIDLLTRAADQAETDAAEMEAELQRSTQPLPPQT